MLGVAGMLFAGYMSAVKFLSDTCAFDKPCPYFLGFPACYYGLAMFSAIVFFLVLDYWHIIQERTAGIAVLAVSALGILFSGYFTLGELPTLFNKGLGAYFFGLPTCAIGLVFYIAIFVMALMAFMQNNIKEAT
jgi:uncharacterized membrane protein